LQREIGNDLTEFCRL